MSTEFEVIGATMKVSGDAPLPTDAAEYDHGDEICLISYATVKEVAFPEDKDGNVIRVHKAKLTQAFVVDAEDAEKVIAKQREKLTGQGNIIAEIQRSVDEVLGSDDDDDDVLDGETTVAPGGEIIDADIAVIGDEADDEEGDGADDDDAPFN